MATESKFRLIALGLLTACTIATLSPHAVADGVDPLDANHRSTEDPLSNQTSSADNPLFDIMHRAQLGNIRSLPEYSKDQQENIGSEASDFRARQRALILQNQQQQPPQSGTATPPAQPAGNSQQL